MTINLNHHYTNFNNNEIIRYEDIDKGKKEQEKQEDNVANL